MSAMRFDPTQLTAAASLNRLRVEIDGQKIPAEIAGKSGFELCSARALAGIIRRRAGTFGLQGNIAAEDHELIRRFDDCLAAASSHAQTAAADVVCELARNMAFIVLAAKRRFLVANLDEWERGYWGHWRKITTVTFGGGIVAGNMGREFSRAVDDQWNGRSLPAVKFLVDPQAGQIAIHGLAGSLQNREGTFLLFDFGGSFVKRAVAECRKGITPVIQPLERVSVPPEIASPSDDEAGGKMVLEFMTRTITATWAQHPASATFLPVSLAAYVIDGNPVVQGGGYTSMRHIAKNVQTALSQEISREVGKELNAWLVHDGTAAAMKYRGAPNLAVITMGTALGVGFAP